MTDRYAVAIAGAPTITQAVRAFARSHGIPSDDFEDSFEILNVFSAQWRAGINTANSTAGAYPYRSAIVAPDTLGRGSFGNGGSAVLCVPIPAPLAETTRNGGPGREEFWDYCAFELLPGALTNGAVVFGELTGRVNVDLSNKVGSVCNFRFALDPWGSSLVVDDRLVSGIIGRQSPARVGWKIGSDSAASVPYDEAEAIEDDVYLVVKHGVQHGIEPSEVIHTSGTSVDVNDNLLEINPGLEENGAYWAQTSWYVRGVSALLAAPTVITSARLAAYASVGELLLISDAGGSGLTADIDYEITAINGNNLTLIRTSNANAINVTGNESDMTVLYKPTYAYRPLVEDPGDLTDQTADSTDTTSDLTSSIFANAEVDDEVFINDPGTSGLNDGLHRITAVAGTTVTLDDTTSGNATATASDVDVVLIRPARYVAPSASEGDDLMTWKAATGSMHRIPWNFQFTASEELATARYYRLQWWLYSFDRTVASEEGVIAVAQLELFQFGEIEDPPALGHETVTNAGGQVKFGPTVVSRTTPGGSLSADEATATNLVGAPLLRAKTNYFVHTDATEYDAFYTKLWDYGGRHGVLDIDRVLLNRWMPNGNSGFTAATYTPSTGLLVATGAFSGYTHYPDSKIYLSGGTGVTPGYYLVGNKLSGNRIRLVMGQTGLPQTGGPHADYAGTIDQYPLVSYMGGSTAGATNVYSKATMSIVYRGATPIGDVVYHDNILQKLFIVPRDPAVTPIFGETLTIKTYRRSRDAVSTTAFTFAPDGTDTAIQTFTVTAGTYVPGPQSTKMRMRISVDGPQNGECEFEVRQGYVGLIRHRSR